MVRNLRAGAGESGHAADGAQARSVFDRARHVNETDLRRSDTAGDFGHARDECEAGACSEKCANRSANLGGGFGRDRAVQGGEIVRNANYDLLSALYRLKILTARSCVDPRPGTSNVQQRSDHSTLVMPKVLGPELIRFHADVSRRAIRSPPWRTGTVQTRSPNFSRPRPDAVSKGGRVSRSHPARLRRPRRNPCAQAYRVVAPPVWR
jgi:hypothetical protein